jgi:hypothetical protein
MEKVITIKCPQCNFSFSVESALAEAIEGRIRGDYEQKKAEQQKQFEEKERLLLERETAIQKTKTEIDQTVAQRLAIETGQIKEQLKTEIGADFQAQIKALNVENDERSKRIQNLLKVSAENEQLKRKLSEREEELRLEYERKVNEQLKIETEKITKRETEKNEMKAKEKDLLIDQLKNQLADAQKKIEQGSVQVQGEVQELILEELLKRLYPMDRIEEIKKGQRGADVIQEICDRSGMVCGKIYYESKRTKSFGTDWIGKLKDDNRSIMADICVLVTQALPDGIEKVGQRDGVWVCSMQDVEWLSMLLRDSIIRIHSVASSQVNKGEKMQMLYDYLTGAEFRLQFEGIVEGFKSLQDSYHDEKLKMQRIWKEREKQLEKVLLNAAHFYGSVKGIASESLPSIKMLEAPSEKDVARPRRHK